MRERYERIGAICLAACVLAGFVALVSGTADRAAGQDAPLEAGSVARGAELFLTSCATCHGREGGGAQSGPSIVDAGAAAVDFQLRTGRMPLAQAPGGQSIRKPPAFGEQSIRDLVAFVTSLGDGPPIPEVSTEASLSRGSELFIADCAACHGATGAGGAVGGGALAPALDQATPVIVAEAMLVGPGQMPLFDLAAADVNAVAAYVDYLNTSTAPGGLTIGNIGTVPEGFVAWLVGMGLLVAIAYVVGREWRKAGQ